MYKEYTGTLFYPINILVTSCQLAYRKNPGHSFAFPYARWRSGGKRQTILVS